MKSKWSHIVIMLVVSAAAYFPVFNNTFTNHDDDRLIVNNDAISSADVNVASYFTAYYDNLYQPLTMLSWRVNYLVSGEAAWSYQLFNLLLHLLCVFLVYRLIKTLTDQHQLAWISALLFGVMAIHVESVAWMSERKDVLYAALFLASAVQYVRYLKEEKATAYVLSLLFFGMALLSKGQAVSLVLTLPLLEWLIKKPVLGKRYLLSKLPFIALAVGSLYITLGGLSTGAVEYQSTAHFSAVEHGVLGVYSYMLLFFKSILPYNLSAFYSYPTPGINWMHWAALLPLALIGFTVYKTWNKNRLIAFALLFFTANVALVLKITPWQTGDFLVADRYAYIGSIGVCVLLGWILLQAREKWLGEFAGTTVAVIVIAIFVASTGFRVTIWKDSVTLWTDVIEKGDQPLYALAQRGQGYEAANQQNKALDDYDAATTLQPSYYPVYVYRGKIMIDKEIYANAQLNFDRACALQPHIASNYYYRGLCYDYQDLLTEAVADYTKCLRLNGSDKRAYNNRGICFGRAGKIDAAIADFNKALEIDPDFEDAFRNRGMALQQKNSR
jgi:tetratricopeptide (TPR) repeat protein